MDIKQYKNMVIITTGIGSKSHTTYTFDSQLEALVFINAVLDSLSIGSRLDIAIEKGYIAVDMYKGIE